MLISFLTSLIFSKSHRLHSMYLQPTPTTSLVYPVMKSKTQEAGSSCPFSKMMTVSTDVSLGHYLFVVYVVTEVIGYSFGFLQEENPLIGLSLQKWILRFLSLGILYFWSVCLPHAFQMLMDTSRYARIGVSGIVHISSSIVAVIL